MTSNEYFYIYANDQEDRYHHLPPLDIAIKVSRILSKRFTVKDIDKNRCEMLADKFNITDYSLGKLLKAIQSDDDCYDMIH
ncbi:hypothetical protein [Leuconostoc pseudomesenteroides]|uniref:hypothetical protein n=1 Tax=Leuconostoc pseudomesenteroides TaxID=33968 RepID=UPI0022865E0E|nr:hypothetical protein [Leuconostoc pseudomesenteroides]WAM37746.1 hypothetical protein OYT93_05940 [Leuconostoc pseudomesenteroides]